MDIKLTLTPRQEDGVSKVTAEFNSHQAEDSVLTSEEYVLKELNYLLDGWANQFDVAELITDRKVEDAIMADPLAVKLAIEAKRAKESAATLSVLAAISDAVEINL